MARREIQPNLSYDTEQRMYYITVKEEPDTEDGDPTQRVRGFLTYQEAVRALQQGAGIQGGVPRKNCTVEEWLNYWMEHDVVRDHAVSTVYGYRGIMRNHLIPELGDIPLSLLTPLTIQMYLNRKMDGGLSSNTTLKHYLLLHTALKQAVQMELLDRNPVDRVKAPKMVAPTIKFYTPEQMKILFSVVEGTWLEPAVKLAGYLGLRRSEICGLRWENVDFRKQCIRIREVRTEIGGEIVVKEPKTKSSARTLSMNGLTEIQTVLQRLYEEQGRPSEGYVLLREDGSAVTPDQMTNRLEWVVHREGLPKITMHGLRHSFASVANSAGIPMFDISKTLGHSNIGTTSTVYTHLFDETQEATLQRVAQTIDQEEEEGKEEGN